jgi:hypothetical protein
MVAGLFSRVSSIARAAGRSVGMFCTSHCAINPPLAMRGHVQIIAFQGLLPLRSNF